MSRIDCNGNMEREFCQEANPFYAVWSLSVLWFTRTEICGVSTRVAGKYRIAALRSKERYSMLQLHGDVSRTRCTQPWCGYISAQQSSRYSPVFHNGTWSGRLPPDSLTRPLVEQKMILRLRLPLRLMLPKTTLSTESHQLLCKIWSGFSRDVHNSLGMLWS